MKILFHANCQGEGLIHFMKYSRDFHKLSVRTTLVYLLELGYTSIEESEENIDWADVIFYHYVRSLKTPESQSAELVPLSVYNNSGYYLSSSKRDDWDQVFKREKSHGIINAARMAVSTFDMGYRRRHQKNIERMKEKEVNEGVPESMRLSNFILGNDINEQQSLTYNHPTSYILFDWANIILRRLDLQEIDSGMRSELCRDLNAAKLPCVDFICTGARRNLGLNYGGSRQDDSECFKLAVSEIRKGIR